jgi:hypothetical protein
MGHLGSMQPRNTAVSAPHPTFEMFLEKEFILEGVHIVPDKMVALQGAIVGQTTPTLSEGSFSFRMYGRFTSTPQELTLLLSVVVSGGVAWIPIPQQMSLGAVDYIAVQGDFGMLSLIIHGLPNMTAASTAASNGDKASLPLPCFLRTTVDVDHKKVRREMVAQRLHSDSAAIAKQFHIGHTSIPQRLRIDCKAIDQRFRSSSTAVARRLHSEAKRFRSDSTAKCKLIMKG